MKRLISAVTVTAMLIGCISGMNFNRALAYDGEELVIDGGFDERNVSGWGSNFAYSFTESDVVSNPIGGGNCLHVTGRWNQWSAVSYTLEDKLEGGMTYRFTADVMYNEQSKDGENNMYDPAEELDFLIQLGTDNDNRTKYFRKSEKVRKNTWTTISVECEMPYDVISTPSLYVETDGGEFPQNRVNFYIDNVSVKEINISDNGEYILKKLNILGLFPDYRAKGGVELPSKIGNYDVIWESGNTEILDIENGVTVYNPPAEDSVVKLTVKAGKAENTYYLEAEQKTASPNLTESGEFTSKPALGWNSFDGYTCAVTEEQVIENAKFMVGTGDIKLGDYGYAKTLKDMGYEYVVVDQAWYMNPLKGKKYELPQIQTHGKSAFHINKNGYWVVDERRFPSAKRDGTAEQPDTTTEKSDVITIVEENNGFKSLADEIHAMGLKFGIHLQRGIPKAAVEKKLPLEGCDGLTADMIADLSDTCAWNDLCYGIDMSKPGAQEYLNNEFKRYAQWGVDYVKIDDLSRPYDEEMIEGYRKAIDNCGRAIYFSASPGQTPLSAAEHASENLNMWRIIDDFWDSWGTEDEVLLANGLDYVINIFQEWTQYIKDYHYPDGDMIPFGQLVHAWAPGYYSNFTDAEKRTVMSVWAINKSPIMLGGRLRGYLGQSDRTEFKEGEMGYPNNENYDDLKYVINEDMININQNSTNVKLLRKSNDYPIWTSNSADGNETYIALVNAKSGDDASAYEFSVNLNDIDDTAVYVSAKEIWSGNDIEIKNGAITLSVDKHDSALIKVKTLQKNSMGIIDKEYKIIDNKISLSGTVVSSFDGAKNCIGILAVYNSDGTLKNIDITKPITIEKNASKQIDLNAVVGGDAKYAKLMLFDSMESMKPMCMLDEIKL